MNDVQSALQTFDDFLGIRTRRNEMDVGLVFVDAIAKDLLALLGDIVQVVDHDDFLFAEDGATRLTECFQFVAEILDALFLQIVDEEHIGFGNGGMA